MLSKISYCSLDEAWNLCPPLDSTNHNMEPEKTTLEVGSGSYQLEQPTPMPAQASGLLSDKQLPNPKIESDFAAFIRNKEDAEQQQKDQTRELVIKDRGKLCDLFLKHIDNCDSCKQKMMERFGKHVVERFENFNNTNYFEIFMIILIGIFIIIIMDSFIRIGKMLKK